MIFASHKGHGRLDPIIGQGTRSSLASGEAEVGGRGQLGAESGLSWGRGGGTGEDWGGTALPGFSSAPHYPLPEKVIKFSSHQRLRAGFTPRPSSHGREIMSALTRAGEGGGASPGPAPTPAPFTLHIRKAGLKFSIGAARAEEESSTPRVF